MANDPTPDTPRRTDDTDVSAPPRLPTVVIIGRPNVGKSTLFNRVVGHQEAIVEDRPGITRDRKDHEAEWLDIPFLVVDTGGWMPGGDSLDRTDIRVLPVVNDFFGGNTGVTGLITGADVSAVLATQPDGHRYLLPDVCLSDEGRFLDGITIDELPRLVEVVPTDGISLRNALNEH